MVKMDSKSTNTIDTYKTAVIAITGSVLISILLLVFVGRPLYIGIKANQAESKLKKETRNALEVKLENLKYLKEKEEDLKKENEKILAALPEHKDLPRLFMQLDSIAFSSGMEVKKAAEAAALLDGTQTQATTVQSGLISSVKYTLDGTSKSYVNIKEVVSKMGNALRMSMIEGITITDNNGELTTALDILTYTRGEQK